MMKKILYYSPYIPVLGIIINILSIYLDFDTCANKDTQNKHFWLSAITNSLLTCFIIFFITFKK